MSTDMTAQEYTIGTHGRLFIAPTKAKDVVVLEGSVFGGPLVLPKQLEAVAGIGAALLDSGTKRRAKNVIRDGLASRGASLSFLASGARLYFSGRCFPEDQEHLLSVIVECLKEAVFPQKELQLAVERALGSLEEEKTDTRARGGRALTQALYEKNHANYAIALDTESTLLKQVARSDIAQWKTKLGLSGLVLSIAGDVDPAQTKRLVEKIVGRLTPGLFVRPTLSPNTKPAVASETTIRIAGKANVDVFLGASLSLRKGDPVYVPLAVASEMLGGGFASHLMQTVRERDGLTYGTYSQLAGFADKADGYWLTWATFSPDLYEKGIDTLRREISVFKNAGMTEESLEKKKEELTGSYTIGLATTKGLARALHSIGVDEKPLSYLLEYPELVRAVTLEQVKSAFDLIPLNRLAVVSAGTLKT